MLRCHVCWGGWQASPFEVMHRGHMLADPLIVDLSASADRDAAVGALVAYAPRIRRLHLPGSLRVSARAEPRAPAANRHQRDGRSGLGRRRAPRHVRELEHMHRDAHPAGALARARRGRKDRPSVDALARGIHARMAAESIGPRIARAVYECARRERI